MLSNSLQLSTSQLDHFKCSEDDPYFPGKIFVKTEIDYALPNVLEPEDDNFKKIWKELSDIVENELPKNGRKRRGYKRRKQSEYDKIIDGLITHSENAGFLNEELELIWKLLSHPASNLNCTQRRKLTFSMVPKTKVDNGLIRSIVGWLQSAHLKGFKPTVVVGVYQLLNLYAMYRIVEENGISNEETLTCLLVTRTENFVIPWKMHLFRTIVTPNVLSSLHINALNKMKESKGAKQVHVDHISASIGVCKHMRPDLFLNNEQLPYKLRNLNFPKDTQPRFYECLLRLTACIDTGYHHPLADRIFPEFLPDSYRTGKFANKNIFETVLESFESYNGIVKIAMVPDLLDAFEQWLQLIVRHRFQKFSQCLSFEDYKRYSFIFEICTTITKCNQEGMAVLSEWVCDTIEIWDFWGFKEFIIGLIPFLVPHHVLPRRKSLREVFLTRFLHCPWLRFEIWCALENLCKNWMKNFETNSTGIEWVVDVLDGFVTSLVCSLQQYKCSSTQSSSSSTPFLIERICKHYIEIQKKCYGMEMVNSALKAKMLQLPDALLAVVMLNDCPNAVPVLYELITRRDNNLATFQLNGDDPDAYTLALPSIRDGSILNQVNDFMKRNAVEKEDVLCMLEGGVSLQRPIQSQQI